ncbi:unnamed protein product [Parnassius apollo]|uniref:(apollo) hypothetical protein n=1 Tax=Parnassius apollo TaxID=110799 RepID=A0A8S3W760_PARAO|nr:unnamed protein product [Parnassius apollo]
MKYTIIYLFWLYSYNVAFENKETLLKENEKNTSRFIEFPDKEGVVHKIDIDAKISQASKLLLSNINHSTNEYLLYTRRNILSPDTLKMNDVQSITSSHFKVNNPTAVIVHGWTQNRNSPINMALRNALLTKADHNVIVLDWSVIADKDYVTAVVGVPRVGQRLGQFLAFLSLVTGTSFKTMHLMGHSLGAHVVGNAGRTLHGQLGRITGLDPAGPLWNINSRRLRESDAIYVEAIHTNGGIYGLIEPVAAADFYPNGGISQPGCDTNTCNHNRSWRLFAASILFDHLTARKCSTNLQLILDNCRGNTTKLGNDNLHKRLVYIA